MAVTDPIYAYIHCISNWCVLTGSERFFVTKFAMAVAYCDARSSAHVLSGTSRGMDTLRLSCQNLPRGSPWHGLLWSNIPAAGQLEGSVDFPAVPSKKTLRAPRLSGVMGVIIWKDSHPLCDAESAILSASVLCSRKTWENQSLHNS